MNETATNARRAQVTWVPVRDASGRIHMEARWELRRSARATRA